jgi:hypothetical protein
MRIIRSTHSCVRLEHDGQVLAMVLVGPALLRRFNIEV